MKALISPNEGNVVTWVSSWKSGMVVTPENTVETAWVPDTSESIEGCARVAEVAENSFDVASPLFWVDCPDECVANEWYYKDGQLQPKPQNALQPETNPGE